MTMVSYAQNCEDVVLMRAFRDIESGFYIDVGAMSPDLHSVTRAFYDRGWSGINVEPNPHFHAELAEQRPRDVNLAVAVGEEAGRQSLQIFTDTGLSTFDHAIANRHKEAGWQGQPREVDVLTLAEVWRRHVPSGRQVHFLKIDVEGYERQVIAGHDWRHCRPWVVLVEATLPMTQSPSHTEWEHLLLEAKYRNAYWDGLNRFYVAAEHAELIPALAVPPNVFDEFKPVTQVRTEEQLAAVGAQRDDMARKARESESAWAVLETRANAAEASAERVSAEVETLWQLVGTLKARLDAADSRQALLEGLLRDSLSRRSIALLRDRTQALRSRSQSVARRALVAVWTRAAASPRFKRRILDLMQRQPRLADLLTRLHGRLRGPQLGSGETAAADVFASEPERLSAEAREVFDLMAGAGAPPREAG